MPFYPTSENPVSPMVEEIKDRVIIKKEDILEDNLDLEDGHWCCKCVSAACCDHTLCLYISSWCDVTRDEISETESCCNKCGTCLMMIRVAISALFHRFWYGSWTTNRYEGRICCIKRSCICCDIGNA